MGLKKLDPLDRLRALAGKRMQDACEHLRDLSRARGGQQGSLVGREDVVASLAYINLSPPKELMDEVWVNFGAPDDKVSIWKVLSKLPAPRAGRSVESLLQKIAGVQKAIKSTIEKKKFRHTAELNATEEAFWQDLNTLRLGADGDDSAFKVRERELMKLVSKSTTSSIKSNSEAALNNFRDLMKRTHENNMIIDLLAPDNHQNWRGTLRHNHLKLWAEKHDAMEHRYQTMVRRSDYQRARAEALAFKKEPFPAQFVLERRAEDAKMNQEKAQMAVDNHRSAQEGSRPGTCCSRGSRPMSRASTLVSDDVNAGVFYLLDLLRQSSLSLNDVLKVTTTSDGSLDRAKFEDIWGLSTADKSACTTKWQNFESLWNYMCKNKNTLQRDLYGKVSVQDAREAISLVLEQSGFLVGGSQSWDMDCRSWRHPDPSIGKTNVSASLYSLLYTIRNRISLRWRKGISDAFTMLESPGHLVGKSEVRAILSALGLHPSSLRFELLWIFFDPKKLGKMRWADFKECFEFSDDRLQTLEEEEEQRRKVPLASVTARRGTSKRKKKKGDVRSESAPPGVLMSELSEDEDMKELFKSMYDVTCSSTLENPSYDKFSKWSPLGRRGYKEAPKASMRPMSVQSERDVSFSSPNKMGHSVHFRMQDVGCQADDYEKLPHLQRGSVDPEQITLTPFSNLRNGSQLKMSWHRWTGGTTRGAQKTSNADPAAPGQTASLNLGSGEFQQAFKRNLKIAEDLNRILQSNPDIYFDAQQRGFKSIASPDKKIETPPSNIAEDMTRFVQTLFPTGLETAKTTKKF